jgi:hypothetical protein
MLLLRRPMLFTDTPQRKILHGGVAISSKLNELCTTSCTPWFEDMELELFSEKVVLSFPQRLPSQLNLSSPRGKCSNRLRATSKPHTA